MIKIFSKLFRKSTNTPLKLFYYDGTFNGVMCSTNVGDELNVPLAKMLSGREVKCTLAAKKSETVDVAIGSLMTFYKPLPNCTLRFWGTGAFKHSERPITGRCQVYALRGKLSKKSMEKRTGMNLSKIALGDPGLLAPALLDTLPKKQYKLGLIPHHANQLDLHNYCNVKDAVIIAPELSAKKFVREAAKCEVILSEAMHGLIIADSLGIPNARIMPMDKKSTVLGDFKFLDYYSVFGLGLPLSFDIMKRKINKSDISKIIKDYKINPKKVRAICRRLVKACPFATDEGRQTIIARLENLGF